MPAAALANKIFAFASKKPLLYVLLLWICSIAIQSPHYNRPLSKHHEFNAALVLICLDNWQTLGAPANVNYTPIIGYQNEGDKFSAIFPDKQGNSTNISFGFLWYLMPWYFINLLGLPVAPWSLQLFNILLSGITLWLVVLAARRLETPFPGATLLMPLLYVTSPAVLWFFGNGYVHEVAVIPFYVAALLLIHSIQTRFSTSKLLLLAAVVFLGALCDWLMAVAAFVIGIHMLWHAVFSRQQHSLKTFGVLGVGSGAAVVTVALLYSNQVGWDNLVSYLQQRWSIRGIGGNAPEPASWINIFSFLLSGYGVALVAAVIAVYLRLKKTIMMGNAAINWFITIPFIVAAVYCALFIQFTIVHDYSMLKMALPVTAMAALGLTSVFKRESLKLVIVTVIVAANIGLFYYINPAGSYARNGDRYDEYKRIGEQIGKIAAPGEVVCIRDYPFYPQVMFYAKRNYVSFHDEQQLTDELRKGRIAKARLFHVNSRGIQSNHLVISP